MAVAIALLAAAAPLLVATSGFLGTSLVGTNIAVVSQGSGPPSLNETLFQALFPLGASAEIFAPTIVRGEPVFVRGVEPNAYFGLEHVVGPGPFSSPFIAYAGGRLADRLGLLAGDAIIVSSSTVPGFAELRVGSIFSAGGPRDDELLVSLPVGRALTGLPAGDFHAIRLPGEGVGNALAILRAHGASVHVSSPGQPAIDVNSNPATDDRITNVAFRTGIAGTGTNYVSQILGQGENSVRTVAIGLGAMVVLLAALASNAVQARILEDKRDTFATLRMLGAPSRWILVRVASEAAFVGAIASAVGVTGGLAVSVILGATGNPVLFGYAVQPVLTPGLVAVLLLASFVILVGGALVATRPFLRGAPWGLKAEPRAFIKLEAVLR